jgi:hypothetical protein
VGRRDVEEDQLVGALAVIVSRELDRVAGIADIDEFNTLDHTSAVDIQARDHAPELRSIYRNIAVHAGHRRSR